MEGKLLLAGSGCQKIKTVFHNYPSSPATQKLNFRCGVSDLILAIEPSSSYPSFRVAGDDGELWKMTAPARISFKKLFYIKNEKYSR